MHLSCGSRLLKKISPKLVISLCMWKVTSLLYVCSQPGVSSCTYSVDGHHSMFSHQPSNKCLFTQSHSPDFATLAFCTVFVLVISGHAGYGARVWPRNWCRFGKQSQVPSDQEGCWTNGTISEFLPLHSFGFRLSIFTLSTMLSWTSQIEWFCPFLSMLCLNQHVQDHLPEAHLGWAPSVPDAHNPQERGLASQPGAQPHRLNLGGSCTLLSLVIASVRNNSHSNIPESQNKGLVFSKLGNYQ